MSKEELYLDNLEPYKEISLISVYITHEINMSKLFSDISGIATVYKPLLIHCSILNKDYNFVNDKKSDIIATIYPPDDIQFKKSMFEKFDSKKFINPSNCLKMYITDSSGKRIENKGKYSVIYELQFF